MKLLSKNGDDPPVQSLGIDRFLGCCSENRELAAALFCFFLSSIFCSLLLLSLFYILLSLVGGCPKTCMQLSTLVSQVNKKLMTWTWALFDGLSSWAKENKPNNNLTGILDPVLPSSMYYFFISNNSFSGEIPSTICNVTSLEILDISYNSLSGKIPPCLGNFSYLFVMDLRMNNFHGTMPKTFPKGNLFITLVFNDGK